MRYETPNRSEGYSDHLHPDRVRGRIDLVYIDPVTADAFFPAARLFPGPAGRRILVPKPEHLAAMKVVAMKNDPSRVFQDLADALPARIARGRSRRNPVLLREARSHLTLP